MNAIERLWKSGIFGKFLLGGIVLFGLAIGAALRPAARPAARVASTASAGGVFIAPPLPLAGTATRAPTPIPTRTAEPQPTAVPPTAGPTVTPVDTPTPQQAAELLARSACGERFRSAAFDGGVLVVCTLKDSWTAMMVVAGALEDFQKIAVGATAADTSLKYVTVQLVATFKDRLGNEAEQPAYTFRMRSSLIQRAQWANMSTKDVSYLLAAGTNSALRESLQIAEDESGAGVHPALRETWETYLKTN